MKHKRLEKDCVGEMNIDRDSLKGIHTHRGEQNSPLFTALPYPTLIKSLFIVKRACLNTNIQLGFIPESEGKSIDQAIEEGIEGKLNDLFSITMFQGGAGTSLNMSINEIIANRALQISGHNCGDYSFIHPVSHVNLHQSTNDVIPTAGKLAIMFDSRDLEQSVLKLQESLQIQEKNLDHIVKMGRTQLQDAFPITLGREMGAYASSVARDRWRIFKIVERLREVNLGGTAIGTGFLAPQKYIFKVVNELKKLSGLPVARGENLIDSTQNTDIFCEVHGILTALSSNLIKISSDLRLMTSGPENGLNEIQLKPIQAGSSIMPGKINPVIPEFVTSCCFRVNSNHHLITHASSSGNFELNPFIPVIIHTVMESIYLLKVSIEKLSQCITDIKPTESSFEKQKYSDFMVTFAITSKIGYDKALALLQEAKQSQKALCTYLIEQNIFSKKEIDALLTPENLLKLGF